MVLDKVTFVNCSVINFIILYKMQLIFVLPLNAYPCDYE